MNRRDFLGTSLLASRPAVASQSTTGSTPANAPMSKRNVVLFVADDHSPDMGCYGNSVIRTPNMDRLAKEGTRFTHAFCTTASCSASRSVILTGLHNHANGHYGHQHNFHKFSSYDNILSLPVYLSHAGYRTARCGKYHVAPETAYKFGAAIPGAGRNPAQMADNCRKFIEEKSGKPFFLYFCTDDRTAPATSLKNCLISPTASAIRHRDRRTTSVLRNRGTTRRRCRCPDTFPIRRPRARRSHNTTSRSRALTRVWAV